MLNTNLYLFFLVILLFGGIVYLLIERKKQFIHTNRIEQQLILTRINHHFIFNSLSAIQSYIFRNDPLQAGKYLSSYAKLIRLILENSKKDMISIDNESKAIHLYLDLQSLRFEKKLSYNIEIDKTIDTHTISIPPFLTLPIIENSIEHGFIQLSKNASINILFKKNTFTTDIEIENTGTGIEKSKFNQVYLNQQYQNHAIELVNERIERVWKINGIKIKLEQIDLSITEAEKYGSVIKIQVPTNT
mgnify:FL=1